MSSTSELRGERPISETMVLKAASTSILWGKWLDTVAAAAGCAEGDAKYHETTANDR